MRTSATKFIQDFIDKVKKINSDDYYTYKVDKAFVFGSYVNDPEKEKLGDIDIAFTFSRKNWYDSLSNEARREISFSRYKGNISFVQKLFWTQTEFFKAIHVHKNSINLQQIDSEECMISLTKDKPGYKIIFPTCS